LKRGRDREREEEKTRQLRENYGTLNEISAAPLQHLQVESKDAKKANSGGSNFCLLSRNRVTGRVREKSL
jgi:hypothetical protein